MVTNFVGFLVAFTEAEPEGMMWGIVPASTVGAALP